MEGGEGGSRGLKSESRKLAEEEGGGWKGRGAWKPRGGGG